MEDRILVVEDEEAISELIEMNLTVAGYEVVQVYDGGKVEEVLEQEAGFDLALVDVMLPGRDGTDGFYIAEFKKENQKG